MWCFHLVKKVFSKYGLCLFYNSISHHFTSDHSNSNEYAFQESLICNSVLQSYHQHRKRKESFSYCFPTRVNISRCSVLDLPRKLALFKEVHTELKYPPVIEKIHLSMAGSYEEANTLKWNYHLKLLNTLFFCIKSIKCMLDISLALRGNVLASTH